MIVTEQELQKMLDAQIIAAGSLRAYCKLNKLSESKVSRIRSGERKFSDDVLKAMKAKRLKTYNVPDSLVIGASSKPKPKMKMKFEDV